MDNSRGPVGVPVFLGEESRQGGGSGAGWRAGAECIVPYVLGLYGTWGLTNPPC